MIDDLRDLYSVNINKNNSKTEYLGTISQNRIINNFFIATKQIFSQLIVIYSLCFSTHLSENLEFLNFDISSIEKNLIQSQLQLYKLNQNVDLAVIILSLKEIRTQKS